MASKNENKTKPTAVSVDEFIAAVEPQRRRDDARVLHDMLSRITGQPAVMWGTSMVGYGSYDYTYDSGRSGTALRIGFSPRKAKMVVYLMPYYDGFAPYFERLGKHKLGKSCLYINKLADVDLGVLEELCAESWRVMRERYPE